MIKYILILLATSPILSTNAEAMNFFGKDGGIYYAHIANSKFDKDNTIIGSDASSRKCPAENMEEVFFNGLRLVDGKCIKWAPYTKDKINLYLAYDEETVILAFQGTNDPNPEKETPNKDMNYDGAPNLNNPGFKGYFTHKGWTNAVNNIFNEAKTELANVNASSKRVMIVGRSMGGALAGYLTYRLLDDGKILFDNNDVLITIGTPRYIGYLTNEYSPSLYASFNSKLKKTGMKAYSVEIRHDSEISAWTQKAKVIDAKRLGEYINYEKIVSLQYSLTQTEDQEEIKKIEREIKLQKSVNANWCGPKQSLTYTQKSYPNENYHTISHYNNNAYVHKDSSPMIGKKWPGDLCTNDKECGYGGDCKLSVFGRRCSHNTSIPSKEFVSQQFHGCFESERGKKEKRTQLDVKGCWANYKCPPFHYCPTGAGECKPKKHYKEKCSSFRQCMTGICDGHCRYKR